MPVSLETAVDHVRGPAGRPVILEYGDYECPYSRVVYRHIQTVAGLAPDGVRFAFRHFPNTRIHPHAMAAAAAAEAAALQGRFWEMSDLLIRAHDSLSDGALRGYAAGLGLDLERFDADRAGDAVRARVERDVASGRAAQVRLTPTVFVDGVLHRRAHDVGALLEAADRSPSQGRTQDAR